MENFDNKQFPVEFLKDVKGIYGIGLFHKKGSVKKQLILRPDMLPLSKTTCAALQMIPGGSAYCHFVGSIEEEFINAIYDGILERQGLVPYVDWMEPGKKHDPDQCKKYHGNTHASRLILNRLMCEALEKAADPVALSLARRFTLKFRHDIYSAAAQSLYANQLIETFPVLGLSIFKDCQRKDASLVSGARRLVESGCKLRDIATLMGIPMSFRHVKPGAAHLALGVVDYIDDPRIFDAFLPRSQQKMKAWLRFLFAARRGGNQFVEWVAKHAFELGGLQLEIVDTIRNISDWVRASNLADGGPDMKTKELREKLFIVRPFNTEMAPSTVISLNAEWHEAVASNFSGENFAFPEPWCPGGVFDGFEILPITNSGELYAEGKKMRHCIGTYAEDVLRGESYIYSVRKDGKRVATLELVKISRNKIAISEIQGPRNTRPPAAVMHAVASWYRLQKKFTFPKAIDTLLFRESLVPLDPLD